MRLTNKHNVPDPVVRAVSRDPYSKGAADFSVTELIDSPRVRALRVLHEDSIEEDVSDLMFSLLGRAVHQILEWGAKEGHTAEERLYAEVNGYTISGAMDLQKHEGLAPGANAPGVIISDYKVTTVASFLAEKSDWHKQLNMYGWLVAKNKGDNIDGLQIVAILRDWTARRASEDNYPASPIQTVQIPVWPFDQVDAYIRERVDLHVRAMQDAFINPLGIAHCTPEERWEGKPYYAVMKVGGKRANMTTPSEEEAKEEVQRLTASGKGEYYIETRGGTPKRCEANWCKVADWCDQYAKAKSDSQST